ncbi:DUF6509 family protein [Bacillus sp. Hm123]|uniref:DUF6509 family protein n=1 Tax=Bacillus sp. Hm123 TaxID=3450745 RepID=UPI003F4352DD
MNITKHTVEWLKDPFGLLSGDRYEFRLYAEVDEEDELYSESGFYIRVLYMVDGEQQKVIHHHLYDRATDEVLDFELEDDEVEMISVYCRDHYREADQES